MEPSELPVELRTMFNAQNWKKSCWKLKKALYGLKQGSRTWYRKLRSILQRLGFRPSAYDPSLYLKGEGKGGVYCLVYVDDILIAAPCAANIEAVRSGLCAELSIRLLGKPKWFLGIQLDTGADNGTMKLSQPLYTRKLLEAYSMLGCTPARVPMRTDTPK